MAPTAFVVLTFKGGKLNLCMRNEPEPLLDHVYQHKSQGNVKYIELTTIPKYQNKANNRLSWKLKVQSHFHTMYLIFFK